MSRSTARRRGLEHVAYLGAALLWLPVAACESGKPPGAGIPLEPPEVLASLSGGVEVRHGGFGSALLQLEVPYPHDKPEGIAILDDSTVAVSNDDDFGLIDGDSPGEVRQKRDYAEIRVVRIR